MEYRIDDLRIKEIKSVISPAILCGEIPVSTEAAKMTFNTRQAVHDILSTEDDRLVVITGPCSIHDIASAKEYASRLKPLIEKYRTELLIIMRVYFEKPRTTVGWKGFINDPKLDGSFEINQGLRLARNLLHEINESGVAAATEYLDLITPQYISDLISWGAIGARTTESQVHRELASGLSCPVGFKNSTDGTIKIAVDAISAASHPHHFLSLCKEGNSGIFSTVGNSDCHIILRGGKQPNYSSASIDKVAEALTNAGLATKIMVDFSHANSSKEHQRQMIVGADICNQIICGDKRIFGVMIESHLMAGRQDSVAGQALAYGQSITDACLGWEDSVNLIEKLAEAVRKRRVC